MKKLDLEYDEMEYLGEISKEDNDILENSKENVEKLFTQEEEADLDIYDYGVFDRDEFNFNFDVDLSEDGFSDDVISTLDEIFNGDI